MSEDSADQGAAIQIIVSGLSTLRDLASKSFIGAINRLVTGAADIPVTLLAGVREQLEDRNFRRRALHRAMTKAAVKVAVLDEGEVQRTLERMVTEGTRTQKNREKIARYAVEEIVGLDGGSLPDDRGDGGCISEDWMSRFISLSEGVSAEEVQRLWAKILVREAAAPGLFSLSTLRILGELDRERAQRFQRMLRHSFGGALPRSRLGLENDTWHNVRMLIQDGLLAPSEGTKLVRNLHLSERHPAFGWIEGRDYNIEVYGSDIESYFLPAVFLTDAGIELSRLVGPTGEEHVAQAIANERNEKLSLDAFLLRPKSGATTILRKPFVLWSRASPEVILQTAGDGSAGFSLDYV